MVRRHGTRRSLVLAVTAGAIAAVIMALVPAGGASAAGTPVQSVVDLGKPVAGTDPYALGVGSSTYGANPLSSAAQRTAERLLDARTVRIPVGYRNGRVTSSAAGTAGTLDVPALVALYRSWDYRIVAVIGGRTNDVDVQPGDATKIMQALGFDGISYTAPNEPGNHGLSVQDQVGLANMITAEGRALRSDFAIMGPVWAYYDRTALTSFASTMAGKLAGLDYHHYAMGTQSLSTAQALAQTPTYGREVRELQADLAQRGMNIPVTVDELNFSWRYQDGTPGGNSRFFTAVNTVWMTSALGHILSSGGRGLPYATQNGPLGIMVESGQVNPDNRPASSPMPAYWAIANWTGGHVWPHYKDTFYSATSTDADTEVFAVNNEADGYNVLLVNKSEVATKDVSLTLRGLGDGEYTAYRNNPLAPYEQPAVVASSGLPADAARTFVLPPMTVTVLVVKKAGTSSTPTPTSTGTGTGTGTGTLPAPTSSNKPAPTSPPPTSSPPTAPTVPRLFSVARSSTGVAATISWQPPASTGGSPITGYRVSRDGTDSTGGGAYATTVPATARTFSFTLLNGGSTYRFSVQAISAIGGGPVATVTSLAPNALSAPTALTAARQQDPTRVTLSWQPPATAGGSPITGYRVSRDGTDSTGGGAYATTVSATTRTFGFTLLNRKTPYQFSVRAITAAGTGPAAVVGFTTS